MERLALVRKHVRAKADELLQARKDGHERVWEDA